LIFKILRVDLEKHYLTDIHQKTIINAVHRMATGSSAEQADRPSGMDVDMRQSSATSGSTENLSSQMQEVYETINVLASGIQTLNDDTQRLCSESVRLQTSLESLKQDYSTLKLSVEEQEAFLTGVKPNQEILQQDVASLKQRIEDMQYVSYDGTLIWKITSFREKMSMLSLI